MGEERRVLVTQRSIDRSKFLEQYVHGTLSRRLAAEGLGVSERQLTRLAKRYALEGVVGIEHGLAGRASNHKTSAELLRHVAFLFMNKYVNFNYKHFAEMLDLHEGIRLSYSTVKRICSGLGKPKRPRRKRKVRRLRNRHERVGFMLQMDGSDHKWVQGGVEWTLIAAIDDATSDVPYGAFFPTESMEGYLRVLAEIFRKHGVPAILYVDRAGWLSGTGEDGQFKRMCDELGITLIYAFSPQAKGRVERLWNTLQDRLVAEFALNQIKTMEEATAYFNDVFLPQTWQRRFTVPPASPESAYRPAPTPEGVQEVFALKYSRKVKNDHTFAWNNRLYRITSKLRFSLAKQMIEIRVASSGQFRVVHSGRVLEYSAVVTHIPNTPNHYPAEARNRTPNTVFRPQLRKNTTGHFY
jgi:transposase